MFQFPSFSFRNVSDEEMDFTYSNFSGSGFTFSGFGSSSGSKVLESFSTDIAGSSGLLDADTIESVFRSQFLSPTIMGTAKNDSLRGTSGNDVFFGGAGRDTFYGGLGDDTYFVTSSRQRVSERKNQGDDTVVSFASSYTLPKNLEYLVLGGSADSSGTGNNLNNILLGNIGNNLLKGMGGSDFLYGFAGADTLYGGGGNDFLWGGLGDDYLYGGNGDDVLDGGAGNDLLDGGDGYDTAIFGGAPIDYTYLGSATNLVVKSAAGETDILQNMEAIEFTDYNFDLGSLLASAFPGTTTIDISSTTGDTTPTDDTTVEDPVFDVVIDVPVTEPDIVIVEDAPVTQDPVQVALADTFTNSSSTKTGQITFEAANAKAIGGIVAVTFENNQSSGIGANIETFGHVFVAGDLRPGETLQAKIGDQFVPVQVNVKATHDDGSVRHAILTMEAPALNSGESVDAVLMKGGAGPTGAAITVADLLASEYSFNAKLDFYNDDGSKTTHSVNAEDLLASSLADGSLETWLSGPMTSEFSVKTKVTDHLEMRFDIRMDADGNIRTDFAVGNESMYTPGIDTFTYDITLTQNGSVVFAEPAIPHHRNSNWHVQTWTDGEPQAHIKFDLDYMADSGAVPHYDTSLGANAGRIAKNVTDISDGLGPMGTGNITQFMPNTGGRGDIGVLPAWTARFLVSQDEDALDVMMGNADTAGSIPWHFIDEATDEYVRIDERTGLWIDSRQPTNEDAMATAYGGDKGGWSPDLSHQPSLSYVPYLVSGDKYHLDNQLAQTTFTAAAHPGNWRARGADGMLIVEPESGQQTRGTAWTIRTFAETAFVTPDDHELSGYFEKVLNANLDYMTTKYLVNGEFDVAGEVEGFFDDRMIDLSSNNNEAGRTSPWMQDFLIGALSSAKEKGFSQANSLLEWSDNFISGRFINGDNGFDPFHGAAYRVQLKDPDTGVFSSTWAELYSASFGDEPNDDPTTMTGYAHSASGYVAVARQSLASTVTSTGSAEAIEAFGFLTYAQDARDAFEKSTSYYSDPTNLIMPRFSDGTYLSHENVTTGSGTLTGDGENELVHGNSGNDAISGRGGIDWLYGYDGDDSLDGGVGDDFIFGGAGNDVIIAGGGNDTLKGNAGADSFHIKVDDMGIDRVLDFDPLEDDLQIIDDGSGVTSTSLISKAYMLDGDTILELGPNSQVILVGTDSTVLTSLNLEVI